MRGCVALRGQSRRCGTVRKRAPRTRLHRPRACKHAHLNRSGRPARRATASRDRTRTSTSDAIPDRPPRAAKLRGGERSPPGRPSSALPRGRHRDRNPRVSARIDCSIKPMFAYRMVRMLAVRQSRLQTNGYVPRIRPEVDRWWRARRARRVVPHAVARTRCSPPPTGLVLQPVGVVAACPDRDLADVRARGVRHRDRDTRGATTASRWNSAAMGLGVLLLSLPLGRPRDHYGTFDRLLAWSPLVRARARA